MADIKNYAAVTAAYWAFTLTDGALRMLVLLHFHKLGYTPLDLAFLFLLYEAMGIVTNFFGGWIGARFGLRVTLFAGLAIQIIALLLLSAVSPDWALAFSVAWVMGAQALSGVAKDLTKMSSKSAVKLVVKEQENTQGLLFKWVALLTGSKNALKGLGFLLGGVLLTWLGFQLSLYAMAGMLAVVLLLAVTSIRGALGKAKQIKKKDLFSKTREINFLSAARIFLFASRDVWFVVGVPVFLTSTLGWSFDQVGGFMAAWVIGYGIVQAMVPRLLKNTTGAEEGARAAKIWGGLLAVLPAVIALGLSPDLLARVGVVIPDAWGAYVLIGGLLIFGLVFAVNSAVHSYLIVAYSDHDKVALNVGFYYMANAVGRLGGTLLSGLVFQYWGLTACLWTSAGLVGLAVGLTLPLRHRA
ncbi:organoarsenical effux MFS transporter ArsJ [Magnetospira sp. QH-2]|uniref:organoarsenical effux MFS transporter ArsJ n=1 Tax=Magnetospira sp. (strain QH-2) TaxID=1288970 RepID=UPI0003E8183B|nr:organoarsenical effux MFS transporter ArsJ [Magnetospira sp. QH-2]CCQ72081.1 Permease of the major facilitator superfamily [Magnetospira sp. QH-2]